MILTKHIKVKITDSNFDHFFILGYSDIELGETILVPVANLTDGSNFPILCKCDKCGIEKKVVYKNYIKYQKEKWGDYHCRKCSDSKRIETLNKNHGTGTKAPINNKEIKNRYQNTLKERYGVENAKQIKKEKKSLM
jgi:hypothetical protein